MFLEPVEFVRPKKMSLRACSYTILLDWTQDRRYGDTRLRATTERASQKENTVESCSNGNLWSIVSFSDNLSNPFWRGRKLPEIYISREICFI